MWLGSGRGFAAFAVIALGSAVVGVHLIARGNKQCCRDLAGPVCDLTISMPVKSRKSFHIDFFINCLLQELVAPSWVMFMLYVICFLLSFLEFWIRVCEGPLVQDSLHMKGCH